MTAVTQIPTIVYSPAGSGTQAPAAAQNSLDPLIAQMNAYVPPYVSSAGPNVGSNGPYDYRYLLQYIDPRFYTAYDPTGTNDQGALLTQCCADARTAGGVLAPLPVQFPGGTFLFTTMATLNAAGTSTGRSAFYLRGMGTTYTSALQNYGCATRFVSGNTTLPIVSANNVYGSVIEKIGFWGNNTAPGIQSQTIYPIDNQSAYISSGVRADPYSPYCAIALDAFNVATAPGTGGGYPGQAYNQNAGEGSSQFTVRDCAISDFMVGIICSPAGSNVQCDDLAFYNNNIGGCDAAYAFCSQNSHQIVIDRGELQYLREVVNTVSWGGAISVSPPLLMNLQIDAAYRIFNCGSAWGPLILDSVYAEGIRTVGQFGGAGSTFRSPLYFKGGSMNLATNFGSNVPPLPPLILERYGPAYSIGTQWTVDKGTTNLDSFNIGGSSGCGPMIFEGCTLPGGSTTGVPPFFAVPFSQNFDTAIANNCWVTSNGGGGMWLSDNGNRMESFNTVTPSFDRKICTWNTRACPVGNTELTYVPANSTPGATISISALTLTVSGGTLNTGSVNGATFTYSGTELLVGDVLPFRFITQGTSSIQQIVGGLKVASVSGTTYTCSLMFDAIEYDVTYAPSTLMIFQRQWAPTQALNITIDGSTNNFTAASPLTALKQADWIANGITGIPSTTRVLTYNATTGAGTLTNNTTGGVTASPEIWFGRLYTPTLTAAF